MFQLSKEVDDELTTVSSPYSEIFPIPCFSFFQLLRNSQSENARLKVEMKALESLLESAKFQLKSTKEKVCFPSLTLWQNVSFYNNNQVSEENVEYEKDKEEDEQVAKKMSEMEEELKMLSYSENLTDQALGQLKDDNERLRGERGSLLQVLYKLSKVEQMLKTDGAQSSAF